MPLDLSKYEGDDTGPFGPREEEAIISLVLDFPEMFIPMVTFITADLFNAIPAKFVIEMLKQEYEKHGIVPTRELFRDKVARTLDVDDPFEEILGLIERKSDPREVPIIRDQLKVWIQHQTLGQLYNDDALEAHHRGDYDFLRKIFDDAHRVTMTSDRGLWFFDQIDEFMADTAVKHISTGFHQLDEYINEGGPSPSEVLVWLAPTGVGKSLMLCNNAVHAVLSGYNVLFVTFELSSIKTALRMASSMSGVDMNTFHSARIDKMSPSELDDLRGNQSVVQNRLKSRAIHGKDGKRGDMVIYELPPDECSVNDIYGLLERNRRLKGWQPDVVVVDYLELMLSRHAYSNKEGDYTKQKSVSTELRGFAKNENVLVFTANQTNRSAINAGDGAGPIDVDKSAESFGKNMPVDYVISINQTSTEYANGEARLWVAKNRNGPKFQTVHVRINYPKMQITEVE